MKKAFKLIGKCWSMVSSLAALASLVLLVAGTASGRLTAARARAIQEAAFGVTAAPGESADVPAKAAAAAPPATGTAAPAPAALLKEIERASMDLRMWEDRIDLLGHDVGKSLATVGEKDQSNQAVARSWDRVKKAMVPLLNQLLAGSPGWQPLTEEEFEGAITAGEDDATRRAAAAGPGEAGAAKTAPASGRSTLVDLLERLRHREASAVESLNSLKGLSPDVLAGILAAGLKRSASGTGGSPGSALSEEQAARLLSSLEPSKLARVFKSLRDEDPDRAAALLALVLKKSSAEEPKASGPAPAVPGDPQGAAKTASKSVGGGKQG